MRGQISVEEGGAEAGANSEITCWSWPPAACGTQTFLMQDRAPPRLGFTGQSEEQTGARRATFLRRLERFFRPQVGTYLSARLVRRDRIAQVYFALAFLSPLTIVDVPLIEILPESD